MNKDIKEPNKTKDVKQVDNSLAKEIEKARKEGKSEAWIRMNLDI